ncbi:glycosyltransferase family 2 protein [Nigerium massiliense]|uniref:glycosyltransferase family 2 protein n=1 Tax=Nigerium massiliense TaxID=1522317 RepID=UPI00058BF32E|nr:glycosyltransferase family 2 protein [Nigerium massiliense]
MTDPKTISFVIPCYNSAAYMDQCVESILVGGDDIEIIIVNDGSTKDNTGDKADEWAARHPSIIKAIQQENAGHGGAVNAGLDAATGVFFKVVDSDDWLDADALHAMLDTLRGFIANDQQVDLVVANYVYEHTISNSQRVINYQRALPENRILGWDEVGHFGPGQNILMHAAIYRTELLRECGLRLPEHTFYVDNIFVYVPLPHVKTLYYLPVDLYRYFIGRDDQSVNEPVMVSRLDQQMRITRIMVEAHRLPQDAGNPRLARYMEAFLALIVAASSIIAILADRAGNAEALADRRKMWDHIRSTDPALYRRLRRAMLPLGANFPGKLGRRLSLGLYRLAQRLYRFN